MPEDRIVVRQHSIPGLLAGLKSGVGVALMSDLVASTDASLILCFAPPVEREFPLWLLTTEHLRNEPRIRALLDFMAGYLAKEQYRDRAASPSS